MAVLVTSFFETRVEQLFDLAQRIEQVFAAAGLEYRVVGSLAAYLYVEEQDPDAGRLTRDIGVVVRREELPKIAKAVGTWTRLASSLRRSKPICRQCSANGSNAPAPASRKTRVRVPVC